jgi:hypothetical protein
MGRMSFIEHHGLWTDAQRHAAAELRQRIEKGAIELVRLSFPDLHGILRGKALLPSALAGVLSDGCAITSSLLFKDTSHRTVVPVFSPGAGVGSSAVEGAGDVILVPDPCTFRMLPWLNATGWMLCDVYYSDGSPVEFAPRHLLRGALARLQDTGRALVTGLEIEFHILRLVDPRLDLQDGGQPGSSPDLALIHQGYNHLTEIRLDQIEPITDILRRHSLALGLDLQSIEIEFGPSQVAVAMASTRPSCAGLPFRTQRRAGGTCISPWRTSTAAISLRPKEATSCLRRSDGSTWPACSREPRRPSRSPRQRSMVTSDTEPIRSRPIASRGEATIEERCCAW